MAGSCVRGPAGCRHAHVGPGPGGGTLWPLPPARLPLRMRIVRASRRSSLGTCHSRHLLPALRLHIRAASEFTGVVSWFAFSKLNSFLCKYLWLLIHRTGVVTGHTDDTAI